MGENDINLHMHFASVLNEWTLRLLFDLHGPTQTVADPGFRKKGDGGAPM